MGIKINEKSSSSSSSSSSINTSTGASGLAKIEITEMGSALHVVLITGLDFKYMLQETIKVLLEEEADIVNASFSVLENHIFHTIHAMVRNLSKNKNNLTATCSLCYMYIYS